MVEQLIRGGEGWDFLPAIDPEDWYAMRDVEPRVEQIKQYLNTHELTDIEIIGFSEGAAATGVFLRELAGDPGIVKNSSEINGAALLECPLVSVT